LADLKAEKSTKAVRTEGWRTKLQPIQTEALIRMNRFGAQERNLYASFDYLS
jgi:hypothetical protein